MKKIFKISLLILVCSKLYSQNICGYHSTDVNSDLYQIINSSNEHNVVTHIVNQITKQIGLYPNFYLIRKDGIDNCYATEFSNIRLIIYDIDFLSKQYNQSNVGIWSTYFIMAHEIGHHLNGHIREVNNSDDKRNMELQADEFAGFIIRKLGGDVNMISEIIKLTASKGIYAYSETHPSFVDRVTAATKGFNSADMQINQPVISNNNIVLNANKIANTIYSESQRNEVTYQKVNERTIKGKDFVKFNKYSDSNRWYVSSYSPIYKPNSGCFIYKYWHEDYHINRNPSPYKNDPLVSALWKNNKGFSYISFTPSGEEAYLFNVWSNSKKDLIRRNKKLFKTKVKLKNIDKDIFPDEVWTNKERTKLLYLVETDNQEYPYKTVFIDLKGYQKVYDCLSDDEKKTQVDSRELIDFLSKAK